VSVRDEEPLDGEERFFWGSKEHPRPFTAVYRVEARSWKRDLS
jgi:hypothetical protein